MTISSLQQLFPKDGKYTFLVGAGCSVDSPSCLPAGRQMMEAIIKHSCIPTEVEKILSLENLRFEQLVEILRDWVDPSLKILDFYDLCENPNFLHMFLAKMLQLGQFVLTTNFDCLIEYALIQQGVEKANIIPVITKEEYIQNSDPAILYQNNKYGVYKIHGSSKNIITDENTKNSLVATIQAFGTGKEGESVFQLESFKRPLFENSTKGRVLVVMGYSGSDDFDIVPTLKLLPEIQQILWIDYDKDRSSPEIVYLNPIKQNQITTEDKIGKILTEILNIGHDIQIYRILGKTAQILNEFHPLNFNLDPVPFNVSPGEWMEKNIPHPDEYFALHVPYDIYKRLGYGDDAERCVRAILALAQKNENKKWESNALNNIGLLLSARGEFDDAIRYFDQALKIEENHGDPRARATRLNNIGTALASQGQWSKAAYYLNVALTSAKQLNLEQDQANRLNSLGVVYDHLGEWDKALDYHNQSLKISEKLGDLVGRSITLSNIGTIYLTKGDAKNALSHFTESYSISDQLGDLPGKKTCLNNIGMVYNRLGDAELALENYSKALDIADKLSDMKSKSTFLGNIGSIFFAQNKLSKAMEYYDQALKIAKKIGDTSMEATALNNIGLVHREQKKNVETIKTFKEALKLFENSKDKAGIATVYYNIGLFYDDRNNSDSALENYQKAVDIDEKIGDKIHKALCLNLIGAILFSKGDREIATKHFREALSIHQQLGNRLEIAKDLVNIAGVYYFVNNDLKKARETLEESLATFQELGVSDSKEANDAEELLNMLKLLK